MNGPMGATISPNRGVSCLSIGPVLAWNLHGNGRNLRPQRVRVLIAPQGAYDLASLTVRI